MTTLRMPRGARLRPSRQRLDRTTGSGREHVLRAVGSGLAGALALNLVHETARRLIPHAPRMDVIAMRAISRPLRTYLHKGPPPQPQLRRWALLGDLVSNTAYFSLVGATSRRNRFMAGLGLGLLAGIGAAVLPRPLGLGPQPGQRTPWTQLLTVLWYVIGGWVAAEAADGFEHKHR